MSMAAHTQTVSDGVIEAKACALARGHGVIVVIELATGTRLAHGDACASWVQPMRVRRAPETQLVRIWRQLSRVESCGNTGHGKHELDGVHIERNESASTLLTANEWEK